MLTLCTSFLYRSTGLQSLHRRNFCSFILSKPMTTVSIILVNWYAYRLNYLATFSSRCWGIDVGISALSARVLGICPVLSLYFNRLFFIKTCFAGKSFDSVVRLFQGFSSVLSTLTQLVWKVSCDFCLPCAIVPLLLQFPEQMRLEPCQKSKMKIFAKIVSNWNLLTIFIKRATLNAWLGS